MLTHCTPGLLTVLQYQCLYYHINNNSNICISANTSPNEPRYYISNFQFGNIPHLNSKGVSMQKTPLDRTTTRTLEEHILAHNIYMSILNNTEYTHLTPGTITRHSPPTHKIVCRRHNTLNGIPTATTQLQHYLNTLQAWFNTDRLKAAPSKSTINLISNSTKEHRRTLQLTLGNMAILHKHSTIIL